MNTVWARHEAAVQNGGTPDAKVDKLFRAAIRHNRLIKLI